MQLKIRTNGEKREIFDSLRKKWLIATPEEVVRQKVLLLFTNHYKYSRGSIAIEHGFTIDSGKMLRADIVVFDREGDPFIVVECKAPSVKIEQETFRQASKYNAFLKAKYIVLTNGEDTHIFSTEGYVEYKRENKLPSMGCSCAKQEPAL